MRRPNRPSLRAALVGIAVLSVPMGVLHPFASNAATAAKGPASTVAVKAHPLSFGASVPSDLQRDESEPATTTDLEGNTYTCGPSGFSQVADYAQVSLDGGDQFHLLGQAPRGQISTAEGGGDCALGTAHKKNSQGHYTLAYAGLGPLTNFSTATSSDVGRTLTTSPVSESVPGVDRQWITFTDDKTAFLNYNSTALGKTIQKSTDGGLTYSTPGVVATKDSGRVGQLRSFIPKGKTAAQAWIYFPYTHGTQVRIALSQDGGATYTTCVAVDDGTDTSAGFASADNDAAGNVYVSYAEKGGDRDTYMVAVTFNNLKKCQGNNNPGFTQRLRMNRSHVDTTVMPWVAAGGLTGRAAVAFYGTDSNGDPDSGAFPAAWYVYVAQVLDAFSVHPHVEMTRVSTHPFHYGSICLGGLGCDLAVPAGDRSLADYFTMELNHKTKKLVMVFSSTGKKPGDASGYVSTPTVAVQNGGPSNLGGFVTGLPAVRTTSPDPSGDAFAAYSGLGANPDTLQQTNNVDALDFTGKKALVVTGAPDGGLTVTFHVKDLGATALQDGLTKTHSASLMWLFRFYNGYQVSAAQANWLPGKGFGFGFDNYTTTQVQCPPGSDAQKCLIFPGAKALSGTVDQAHNQITLRIPRSYLRALAGPSGNGQVPREVAGGAGTRIYEAGIFGLANPTPPGQAQTYMELIDNAPTMDIVIPKATRG